MMQSGCQYSWVHGSSGQAQRLGKEQGFSGSLWQTEFFDRILRSGESYTQKWNYVRDNPVRDGLVMNSGDWPWQGEIEVFRF